jgi:hypothetical protein
MISTQTIRFKQPARKCLVWLLTFAVCFFNSGCGGGGGLTLLSGVGSGGTGSAVGTIVGFGSVIVDGQRIDDTSAVLEVESEPGSPNRAGIDELYAKLGQQAFITTDVTISSASSIQIHPAVIGEVDSIDLSGGKIVVAGQDILFNTTATHGAPTILDGYEQLSDISVGDQVLVHGHLQYASAVAATQVQAARIELQPPGVVQVRVTGTVAKLDSNAMQFYVGSLLVKYNSTVTMLPNGATLSNGQSVVVWSANTVSNGQLQAQIISTAVDSLAGMPVRVGGLISGCGSTACAGVFKVDGLTVDPSSASITGGTTAQFIDGQYAAVVGTADPQTGIIKATSVVLRSSDAIDTTLYGAVFDPVSGSTFLIHGVPVMVSANTAVSSGCAITEGQAVQVTGSISGNRVTAQNISCISSLEGLTVDLRGVVSSLNLSANNFHLSNALETVPVNLANATFIDGTSSSLTNGGYVVVSGKVKNGTLAAKQVRIAPAPVASQFEMEGIAYAVKGTTSFKINGLVISFKPSAVVGGTLMNGHRVRVQFTANSNGAYQAVLVTIL